MFTSMTEQSSFLMFTSMKEQTSFSKFTPMTEVILLNWARPTLQENVIIMYLLWTDVQDAYSFRVLTSPHQTPMWYDVPLNKHTKLEWDVPWKDDIKKTSPRNNIVLVVLTNWHPCFTGAWLKPMVESFSGSESKR